ncbi:MAG TPA: response regulator [Polyangiales bacterium]|nr:response regulator [Polyangiales bacterium]
MDRVTQALPRLLLVDDEQNVIEGLSRRLRRDYRIFAANDGEEAMRLLEREGEMHIVVSDMRMPNMNGAQLLAEVRKTYPDMIRILLTGQADLEAAIAAVNEGQIFRFLAKPCPAEVMRGVLRSAMRQHELLNSEHVLLEKTLCGTLSALSDVLASSMPDVFGKLTRLRDRAAQLAAALGLPDVWRFEAAAMLSQVPAELLGTIPRLEPVCDLVAMSFGGDSQGVPPMIEAQVLRLCADYDALRTSTGSPSEAAARLREHAQGYDPKLLKAFFEGLQDS